MASKFLNLALSKAVAAFLNVKDPKDFPSVLHTDELTPVLAIPGPTVPENWQSSDIVNIVLSGLGIPDYYVQLWGNTNLYPAVFDAIVSPNIFTDQNPGNKAHKVRAVRGLLTYNAAGALADNGTMHLFQIILYQFPPDPAAAPPRPIPVVSYMMEIKTAYLTYEFVWPEMSIVGGTSAGVRNIGGGKWDGYVPPGWMAAAVIQRYALAGAYPAATTWNGQIAVSEVPLGVT